MLAFRKAITCLKKSFEATETFVQRPKAEVGIREEQSQGLGATPNPLRVCGGNWLGFFIYFCSILLWKRILLGFLGFCVGTFRVFRTLLPEDSDVVPFCVCKWISFFYRRTVVVRLD